MLSDDEFKKKFFSCRNHFEKVQVCIREDRYSVWDRPDKPNLNDKDYLDPVLGLPSNYSYEIKRPRASGGPGENFVVTFTYTARIMGADLEIYFKGFFSDDWVCRLKIQSLRENED